MNVNINEGIYPQHHTKIIHLVRHAQGTHNVAADEDPCLLISEEYFDAQLTPLGWDQVDNLQKHLHASGIFKNTELVIVSPLMRTMQTAAGAFGGGVLADGSDVPPLMAEFTGGSNRPAVSSLNCPPFIANELIREHVGFLPCDRRRSITEYKPMFPAIDFSLVENDEDVWWKPNIRETDEEIAARGVKFMKWLLTRKEKEIAVVTHSGLLHTTLGKYGDDCHPTIKEEMSKQFSNCELRSMVNVDRG
ncbi:phosphoglycerate mutase-like protein [Bidens hawaiensis]|uniref:phosphoglycerate mutase-like protein n=1 Tax=Bidens hawaiensis TaxID=980011 RepID=UPI0040490C47